MSYPWGIAFSAGKLFIVDNGNHRILAWNGIPTASGAAADFVLGQPDMTSSVYNNGGLSGSTLYYPGSIYSDGTKLFVADKNNHRVLIWNTTPTTTAQSASFALGQTGLTSNSYNSPQISGSTMYYPAGVFTDGTRLFVSDVSNYRLLVWNTTPTTSGQAASFAIGQPDFGTNVLNKQYRPSATSIYRPKSIYADGTKMVVTDYGFNRVLIYNTLPIASGQAANVVLGQPDFTSNASNNGGISASSLNYPASAIIVGTKLFVADSSNNRVLGWNTIPTTNGQAADFVLGQPNLTSNTSNNGGVSASSLYFPEGMYSDGTRLYVADSNNHRVLVWNSLPSTNGEAASFALGQTNLTSNSSGTSATTMSGPTGVYSVGTKLFVADWSNNRVLIWNAIPTTSGQAADFALGQPTLTSGAANNGGLSGSTLSNPYSITSNGTKLYVAEQNNQRVLVWNTIPTTTGQTADAVYGQADLTSNIVNSGGPSANTFYYPRGIFATATKLFISDYGNNRILVIPAP
jgi:hypothetical protein